METDDSRAAEVELEGPLRRVHAEYGMGGWWPLWLLGKMVPRRHSFGWSWRLLCATLCLLRMQHGKPPTPDSLLSFLPEAEGVRELSKAGILSKCSWGQRVERNLITLCIKHAIIQYINRCRDIHGIRISRGVFCFVLYFFPYVLVGDLF